MDGLKTIIGIRSSVSKSTGKKYFTYYMMEGFTDYEKENGECHGSKVSFEGSSIDFGVHVGDQVKCYYDKGYKDQATLSEMIVKGKASNTGTAGK